MKASSTQLPDVGASSGGGARARLKLNIVVLEDEVQAPLMDARQRHKQQQRQRLTALSHLRMSTASDHLPLRVTDGRANKWRQIREEKTSENMSTRRSFKTRFPLLETKEKLPTLPKIPQENSSNISTSMPTCGDKCEKPVSPVPSTSTRDLQRKLKTNHKKVEQERRRIIAGSSKPRLKVRPSYLDLLEQRQEFRKALVNLLHSEDAKTSDGKAKLKRRYHYFVNRGLSMNTCPLQKQWIAKILALVPKRLRTQGGVSQALIKQLQKEYEQRMRGVAIEFVLNSGKTKEKPENKHQGKRVQLDSFLPSRHMLGRSLHLLNPCILATLQLWHREYSGFRLFSVPTTVKGSPTRGRSSGRKRGSDNLNSIELEEFERAVGEQFEQASTKLEEWFVRVQTIFYKGFQDGRMPGFNQPTRLASVCHTAVTLMTHCLRSLCVMSLSHYTASLCGAQPNLRDAACEALWSTTGSGLPECVEANDTDPTDASDIMRSENGDALEEDLNDLDNSGLVSGPDNTDRDEVTLGPRAEMCQDPNKPLRIKLHLVLNGTKLEFEPSLRRVESCLLSLFGRMVDACHSVPRLESRLFAEWEGKGGNMEPVLDAAIVSRLRAQAVREVRRSSELPRRYAEKYRRYQSLISAQAEEETRRFISEGRSFDEYMKKVAEFSELRSDILTSSDKVVELGQYSVHCDQLVSALVTRVSTLRRDLLNHLHHLHSETADSLRSTLDDITTRALSTPRDTLELVEHRRYMEDVMERRRSELEKEVWGLHAQLQFLAENMALSSEECEESVTPLRCFIRLPEVFRLHLQIVTEKRAEYEVQLKDRRVRFQEELAEYNKQLDDFQAYGDVASLHDYERKARNLYDKLDRAALYTDQMNKEEEALGWNTTQYPLRKQVVWLPYSKSSTSSRNSPIR